MRKPRQLEFKFPEKHGGARKGAGRKMKSAKARVSHERKAGFWKLQVLHITCTLLPGLSSLRDPRIATILMACLARCCEKGGFRIVEFSIQGNHLHMICEAESQEELSRAMQGLMSGMARTLNRELKRKGRIFADRYHSELINSPTQCRNTLLYVLANSRKHGVRQSGHGSASHGVASHGLASQGVASHGVDPWSTAAWFPFTPPAKDSEDHPSQSESSREAWMPAEPKPAAAPQSWLLKGGWRRGGSIRRHDHPKSPQQRRRSKTPRQLGP